MKNDPEINQRWQFLLKASNEFALFWYEKGHLPEDEFVCELQELSGLSILKQAEKKYSNSYNSQGDIICTPFVADIKNTTNKTFCEKKRALQIEEANRILAEQAGNGPLNTIMRALQVVCGDTPIFVHTSPRKSQHVMFHRFCSMVFCIVITIMSRQNPLAFGDWKLNKNKVNALDFKPVGLAQELARKSVVPPDGQQFKLIDAITNGCRGVCDYAESNGLIMNVLMKLIAEFIDNEHRCSIKSNITDISLSHSRENPLISNITPIDNNGIGTITKGRISRDLSEHALRGLYGAIETMLENNGSANIPSMESNSSMMNYMLLSSNGHTGRLMFRASATNLVFHKGLAA